MLRLRTLGGLSIEDEHGRLTGAIARPRSLALLALVAMATEQGLSRDRVLAYLWPESDTSRARNNLKQTLFQLRQDLREEVFLRRMGALRLDPKIITADACEFEASLARGHAAMAVALYQGPFLDGFYLPGLDEFERWVEIERARLAQRYADAVEGLATDATRLGEHRGAADWWRRLAALDPLSSRRALGLMHSLAQAGDRAAALEHARVYEELVRDELNAAADPEITEYAEQLRAETHRRASGPRSQPQALAIAEVTTEPRRTEPPPEPRRTEAPTAPPPKEPAPTPKTVSRSRFRAGFLLGLTHGILALAAVWWLTHNGPRQPASSESVVVFPFTFTGGGETRYLGSGMVDLLSTGLDGAGQLRSVHPSAYLAQVTGPGAEPLDPDRGRGLARQLGAELYVLGEIVANGPRLRISAAMYDRAREDPVARSSVEGGTAQVFELVDRLASGLIAGFFGKPHERLARVAAVTTRSLPAFKAYLDGEQAYRGGRYAEAIEALEQAVGTDSTFALAYFRLSDAADRAGRPQLAQESAERALRYRDQLAERERRLIEAQHAWRQGDGEEAERLYRSLVADYPDDVEAWLQLGEVLAHGNPLRGRSSVEARPAFEQVLARDTANGDALIHLARIAYLEGKPEEVDTLVRRALAADGGSEVVETRAFRAFVLGDRPGQKRVTQRILANPRWVSAVTALDVAVLADDLEGTERFGRWLTGASQDPDLQGYGHRMLAQTALARGQWRRARTELQAAAPFDSIPALELQSLFAALSFLPLPDAEILAVRESVRRWNAALEPSDQPGHTTAHSGLHPYLRLHRLGLLDARLGDTTAALQEARALDQASDSSARGRLAHTLAQSVRAHVAAAGGRDPEALAELETAGWEAAASVFVSEAYDRYFRAELLERLGRENEALGWYGSIAERAAYELVYLAPAQRRQAEIYALRGQHDLAARHYRRFIELWSDADPELQPAVAEARRRLADLR